MVRRLVTVVLVLAVSVPLLAQHKIPPLPDTASAPVKQKSGLTVIDIKVGTGIPAEKGRMVRITYTGWVSKTQVMIDFRDEHTGPLAFHLGDGSVLKGLELGIYGMRVDGKRRLIIPPRLGHGAHATRAVPANSELTYDVELVSVAKPGV